MIVGKKYIGGNRLFWNFFYYALLYGRVVATKLYQNQRLLQQYERLLWVEIYEILLCSHTSYYYFWRITYLHTKLQRKKIDLRRIHKGLVALDLCVYTT